MTSVATAIDPGHLQPAMLGGALLGGAVAGSTAGAALRRWPRGERLSVPARSRCDGCGARLRVADLVPVVSWLLLRGRCRSCAGPIGRSVLAVEASSIGVVVATVLVHGPTVRAAALALGAVALLVATATDVAHRIIPDRLTLPLAAFGGGTLILELAVAPSSGTMRVDWPVLVWVVGVPSVLRAVALLSDVLRRDRPVGGGDIKLLVGVLALVGVLPGGPVALLLLTVILAGTVALVGLATGRLGRGSRLPLAPSIAVAYLLVVLASTQVSGAVDLLGGGAWLR